MAMSIYSLMDQIVSSLDVFETQLLGLIDARSSDKDLKGMIINCYCIRYINDKHATFTADDHDWLLCELRHGKLEWMQRILDIPNGTINELQNALNGNCDKSKARAYAGIGHNDIGDQYLSDAYSRYGVDVLSPYSITRTGSGSYEIRDSLKRVNILYYEKGMLAAIEKAMGFSPMIVSSKVSDKNITLHVRDVDLQEDFSKHSFEICE